jgi:transposase
LYVYGFVEPSTGATQWLLLPTVSAAAFAIALEAFAKAVGAGPRRKVLLVVDGAGWHKANDLRIPDGIELAFLPAYSPELQPAERLWPLLHEALANRPIDTLDQLEEILVDRCRFLHANSDITKSHTKFHWWPTANDSV